MEVEYGHKITLMEKGQHYLLTQQLKQEQYNCFRVVIEYILRPTIKDFQNSSEDDFFKICDTLIKLRFFAPILFAVFCRYLKHLPLQIIG